MTAVFVNGKFTAQRTTGVQRVAACLSRSLRARLLRPPAGTASLHLWEQAALPWAARRGLLVNLAGAAPWFASRQVCLLHDAAVFDRPEAYTRPFVAWYRRLFRHLARSSAELLTVSAFSRQRLALHLGVDPSRLTVLPNGADHLDAVVADAAALERHGLVGTRYLLAVASANPTKNLPALLDAYARLAPDGARRLVVVGGRNAAVFADGARPDPPGVVRTGAIDDAALKALYQHATALVFPSTYEGFGLPLLEAMACGCPVAASSAAAMPEVCGDAALYFDPGSVDAIEAALRNLLDDADLRARLRAAGRLRAARFRWCDSAERLQRLLDSLEPR